MGYNKFGGFGGGMNVQNMIKQAQRMQAEMEKKQEELADTVLTGVSGGGMVEVTITGKKDITGIKIDPQVVDPDDVEMLEDLVLGAIKDAQSKADNLSKDALGGFGL